MQKTCLRGKREEGTLGLGWGHLPFTLWYGVGVPKVTRGQHCPRPTGQCLPRVGPGEVSLPLLEAGAESAGMGGSHMMLSLVFCFLSVLSR